MKKTSKARKIGIVALIVLNIIVLLGQIWPDGAPPFAKTVNIVFLILNMFFISSLLVRRKSK